MRVKSARTNWMGKGVPKRAEERPNRYLVSGWDSQLSEAGLLPSKVALSGKSIELGIVDVAQELGVGITLSTILGEELVNPVLGPVIRETVL